MSDVQQGPGWWLASDGKWYPPESRIRPLLAPPTVPPLGAAPVSAPGQSAPSPLHAPHGDAPMQRRSVSAGLGGTIQGFSWAVGGLSAIGAILAIASLISFNAWWETPINSRAENRAYDVWIAIDDSLAVFGGLALLAGLVVWILLMIWMNQAHKTTQQLWSGRRQWSSGWTVGGWFIPVANAVIPKLVLGEIERIALAPRSNGIVSDASRKATSTSLIGKLWWITLVVGAVVTGVANSLGSEPEWSADEFRVGYGLNAVGFTLVAVSGVLGALYVRRISARLSPDGLQQSP